MGAIVLPLQPGESLISWCDRIAHDLQQPWIVVANHLGIAAGESWKEVRPGFGVVMDDAAIQRVHQASGIPPEKIAASLLSHYAGAVTIEGDPNAGTTITAAGRSSWAFLHGSFCCPQCLLEDDVWQLSWKLPWHAVCLKHKRVMLDLCPACRRRPRAARQDGSARPRHLRSVPNPGLCNNAMAEGLTGRIGTAARPCGFDLRTMVTGRAPSESVEAVKAVLDLIEPGSRPTADIAYDVAALRAVTVMQLRSLSTLVSSVPEELRSSVEAELHVQEERRDERAVLIQTGEDPRSGPRTRLVAATPKDAALMAALLPRSVALVAAARQWSDTEQVPAVWADSLRQLRSAHGGLAVADLRALHLPERHLALATAFADRDGRLSVRLSRAKPPSFVEGRALTSSQIPQHIWEDAYAPFEPLMRASHYGGRRFVAAALVRRLLPGTTWAAAETALGLPAEATSSNHRVAELSRFGTKERFADELEALLHRLLGIPAPPDYRTRERKSRTGHVDAASWKKICQDSGQETGKGGKQQHASAWLQAQIAGIHPGDTPAARRSGHDRGRFVELHGRFVKNHLPALAPALVAHGRLLLTRAELSGPVALTLHALDAQQP